MTMVGDYIIEFRDVQYGIDGGPRLVCGLDLRVERGETLVLLGRSGSGKTTTLKLINGLLAPSSGEVLVEGRATTAWDPIRLRRRIGYAIQEVGLFPHFTVERNVGLVPRLDGWPEDRIRTRASDLLQQVGLTPDQFLARFPRELSGGQRQRVGVARALAADPRILLFDEPFGAVDPVTRQDLQNQFLELRRSFATTSVFVTHDVREALRLGSRIGLMHQGKLEVLAPPDEFLRADTPEARTFLASA